MPILKLTGKSGEYIFNPEDPAMVLRAKGKFGSVFAGVRLDDNRKVIIKHFNNDLLVYPYSLIQFRFEADAVLDFPQLRKTFEYITTGQNHFLIQEYISGNDLKDFLSSNKKLRQSVPFILKCMNDVLDALVYLHSKNIIHCDLKPANILIETDNKGNLVNREHPIVKLIDLGNARTPLNLLIDTVQPFSMIYSPPELILQQYDLADAQSDVYQAGLVIYELVSGNLPFTSRHPEALIHQQLSGQLTPHPSIPAGLFDIIQKATAKVSFPLPPSRMSRTDWREYIIAGKKLRYVSATEMKTAIEDFLSGYKESKRRFRF